MHKSLRDLLAEYVIVLTVGGHKAYLAKPGSQWDAAWYTRDIGTARRYKRQSSAERVIASYGRTWSDPRSGLNAHVEPVATNC